MQEVVIKFEPFVLDQTIFIKNLDSGNISEEHIPQKELANYLSLMQDVKQIHFFGNEKFAEKIKTECLTKYKMDKIEITINR